MRCAVLAAAISATVFSFGLRSPHALAQSRPTAPNATIRGELSRLWALPSIVEQRPCRSGDCTLTIPPLHISLAVGSSRPVKVVFTEAEGTRHIRREGALQSTNDVEERPILLRGFATIRHSHDRRETTEIPVAGTIYRDNHVPQLEVAVTHMNRRAPGQMVVARALLSGESLKGRAVRASSYAFAHDTCGASHAHGPVSAEHFNTSTHSVTASSIKTLFIGTDFDREFMVKAKCKTASKCNNQIVSLMNKASVFYQKPASIRLKVERQQGPVKFTIGTSDASEMLNDYQSYIETYYPQLFHDGTNTGARLVDGFAGFTGKNMLNRVVGIATLGVYCDNTRSSSASTVIRHTTDAVTPLVIAHEIGHNLNAYHTSSGIMAPSVSKVGKKPQFSRESVAQIKSYANGWYEECRAGAGFSPPPGSDPYPPALTMTVGTKPGFDFSINFTLENKRANCKVVARAAESSGTVDQGTIVFEEEMNYSGMGRSTTFRLGIDAATDADSTVFFKGYYVCSGDETRAQTSVVSFVAPNIFGSYPVVSRAEWIQALREQLL